MLPNNAFKVWIFYFTSEIVRFALATYGLYVLKNIEQEDQAKPRPHIDIQISQLNLFKKLLIITIIMTVVITLEDTIVIFFHDSYALDQVHMTNRSISEDILAFIYAGIAIIYLAKDLIKPTFVGTLVKEECAVENTSISQKQEFGYTYNMTSREIEVLMLLLENKSNLEISNELFISMGTVKSHIHNIFIKLDVTRRQDVQKLYSEYHITS